MGSRGIKPWLTLLWTPLCWLVPFLIISVAASLLFPGYLKYSAGPFGALFIVYAWQRFVMQRRRRNGLMALEYVEMAVRMNLPLAVFLDAAERSEAGRF